MAQLVRSDSLVDCTILHEGNRNEIEAKRDDILTKKNGEPRWVRSLSKNKLIKSTTIALIQSKTKMEKGIVRRCYWSSFLKNAQSKLQRAIMAVFSTMAKKKRV